MVSNDKLIEFPLNSQWGCLQIIELIGMDVFDQYIWGKSNFIQKMDEFRLYFNKLICSVFGVQPIQLE